jgi:hypothetical protein
MLNSKKELQIVSKKNKSGGGQKGVSVYLALMIMIIVLAIGLGINVIIVNQMKMIRGMGDSVVAICAADTGIERVLYEDKLCRQGPPCGGLCFNTTDCDAGLSAGNIADHIGSGSYQADYQVSFDDGATVITSTGIYKGAKRTIEVKRQ